MINIGLQAKRFCDRTRVHSTVLKVIVYYSFVSIFVKIEKNLILEYRLILAFKRQYVYVKKTEMDTINRDSALLLATVSI